MKQAHLNRDHHARQALFKGQIVSLIEHEVITTTTAKAKVLESLFSNLLSKAKKGTLAARRHVQGVVKEPRLVKKVVDDLAKRYESTNGGYTKRKSIGVRRGDNAPMVRVALTKSKIQESALKSKSAPAPSKAKVVRGQIKSKPVTPAPQKPKTQVVNQAAGRIGFRQGER